MRTYAVYILASNSRVLCTGVIANLKRRVWEHREKIVEGFTARYKTDHLVHFEVFHEVTNAIESEKQLKGWRRARKIALVTANNPEWRDLYDDI